MIILILLKAEVNNISSTTVFPPFVELSSKQHRVSLEVGVENMFPKSGAKVKTAEKLYEQEIQPSHGSSNSMRKRR